MDDKRFQQMEKRLNEQVEATQAMNETLNTFLTVMSNIEVAKSIAPPHPVIWHIQCLSAESSH
jgi:hypothetical protein